MSKAGAFNQLLLQLIGKRFVRNMTASIEKL